MFQQTLKKALLGSVMVAGLMATMGTTPAAAGPLGMSGQTQFHFTNWEDTVDTTTSGNRLSGLIEIDNIKSQITVGNPAGNGVYQFASGGPQIVGYFTDLFTTTPAAPGTFRFTGGEIKLYYKASCNNSGFGSMCFDPTKTIVGGIGNAPIDGGVGAGITDGTLVLDLLFNPPNALGPTDTLDGTFSPICQGEPFGILVTGCGSGSGFLDTSGTTAIWNKFFDTNAQPDPYFGLSFHDMSLQNTFFFRNTCNEVLQPGCSLQNGWTVTSDDPVTGFVKDVPEPMTLSLFGMGLLGMGFMNRRRNQKAAKA